MVILRALVRADGWRGTTQRGDAAGYVTEYWPLNTDEVEMAPGIRRAIRDV